MLASISTGDWEELQRLLNEQREEEAAAQPKKAFVHKEYPYRCVGCQLSVRVASRLVCQATGRTVSENDYPVVCAHLPIEKASDD